MIKAVDDELDKLKRQDLDEAAKERLDDREERNTNKCSRNGLDEMKERVAFDSDGYDTYKEEH